MLKNFLNAGVRSQNFKKYTTETIKTQTKPGKIKKFLKIVAGTIITVEAVSFTTASLFNRLDPGTDIYLTLSPIVQPLEILARVQRSISIMLFIYSKHYAAEWYYKGKENELEMLSEIYKKNAEMLLNLFNKNGGTYRKIGQEVASMRDFLPDEYCNILSKLFDQVPAEDFDSIKYIFRQDFGKSVEELFSEFDKVPMASASLAQVHRAVTFDGKEVAVKVQYPRVQYFYTGDIFTQDLVDKFMQLTQPRSRRTDMDEIKKSLEMELNFIEESKNALKVKENFKNQSWIYVPDVEKSLTSKRILTMEYIHGIKGNDPERMKKEGFSLSEVATKLFGAIAEQTFTHGFLHADMHGGNFFVRRNPDNLKETQVVLIDHGLYNKLSEDFRLHYCKFWKALILRDNDYIKEYCDKYNIKDPNFYSGMILMQGFDKVGPGPIEDFDNIGKKMTRSKRKKMMENMNTKEMEEKMENMFLNMPLEMLLIMRTNFLLRSVNQILGAPVNRFSLFARVAARNVDVSDRSTWIGYFKSLKNQISFDLRIKFVEFTTWISSIIINLFGFESFISNKTSSAPKNPEALIEKNEEIAVELTPIAQD